VISYDFRTGFDRLDQEVFSTNTILTPVVAESSIEDLHPSQRINYTSNENLTSMLSLAENEKCKNIKNEHELFQFLTPYLIFIGEGCNRVFVNSEKFG